MLNPYFYKLFFPSIGKIYVGIQYGKKANPRNLLKTYFTSSKFVLELLKTETCQIKKIKTFETPEQCRLFERRFLKFWYNILGKEIFLQTFVNRNLAPGILFDEDLRNKLSNGLKKSYQSGTHKNIGNPPFLGKHHTQETKEKLRISRESYKGKNHPRGMLGKKHTNESNMSRRLKLSGANSVFFGATGENHPTGATIWYNNGLVHIRSKTHPGDGWIKGRIFKERKKKNDRIKING